MYALPATGNQPAPEIEELAARAADAAAAIAKRRAVELLSPPVPAGY